MNQPIASVQHLKIKIKSKSKKCTRIKKLRRKLRLFQGGRQRLCCTWPDIRGTTLLQYINRLAWTCQLNWQIECGIDRYVDRIVYPDWYVASIDMWAGSFILIGRWNWSLRGLLSTTWPCNRIRDIALDVTWESIVTRSPVDDVAL